MELAAALRSSLLLAVVGALGACGGSAAPASTALSSTSISSSAAPSSVASSALSVQPLSQRVKVRLSLNTALTSSLPFELAKEKGYFDRAGLDVDLQPNRGASAAALPLLARGDVDVLQTGPVPGLFAQAAQGFDIKVVAGGSAARPGRPDGIVLGVLKDEAAQIKQLTDLKGKTVDGAAEGSGVSILAVEAIKQAGLTPGKDVTLTYRAKTQADMLALAKGRAADVIGLSEPTATQAEQAGYISRWKGLSELAPWYQPGFNAVSATFLQANRPAVEKLFEVTTLAGREINASNGDWTPEMLAIATKYTEQSADIIKGQGPAPYNDPNASVSVESLQKTQDAWLQQKQINQAIDVNKLADLTVMDAVIQRIGRATS